MSKPTFSSSTTRPVHPLPPLHLKSYPPHRSFDGRRKEKGKLETKLKNHEEDPYKFTLEVSTGETGEQGKRSHSFELSLSADEGLGSVGRNVSVFPSLHLRQGETLEADATSLDPTLQQVTDGELFLRNRVTFQRFIEEPDLVDQKALVIRYQAMSVLSCRSLVTKKYRLIIAWILQVPHLAQLCPSSGLARSLPSIPSPSFSRIYSIEPFHISFDTRFRPNPEAAFSF
jgi:hypothetical protein